MGVLELFFLLWIVPKRIRPLARERGRSGFLWTLAAIGAWIGCEFLVFVVAVIIYELGIIYFEFPEGLERSPVVLVVSLFALIAGLIGSDVVRRVLTSIPVASKSALPAPPVY
jgi:hypothetical protein